MFCRIFYFIIFLTAFVFSFSALAENKFCEGWFANSGIKPGSNDCTQKCILSSKLVDLICTLQCDYFCIIPKCITDSYWERKLKEGKPSGWSIPKEFPGVWKESDKKAILEILSSLPDQLKSPSFEGFYRLKKSVDLVNPATTSENGNAIVIYDRAFDNPNFSLDQVITHEIGHILYMQLTSAEITNYSKTMGWKKLMTGLDSFESRSDGFISSRSKDNPAEDFAENISFFLLNPINLKSKAPSAYKWILKKFSNSFKVKQECQNEKN